MQIAGDGRQGRRHDRLVERSQEHPQHERGQHDDNPTVLFLPVRIEQMGSFVQPFC
jgi:hypothetical protein